MGQQRRMRYLQQNQAEDEEDSTSPSIQESKEKIIDACAQYIEKHAKQTIISFVLTYLLLEIFIVLILLNKLKIFNEERMEITLSPLILNSLQILIFSWLQIKSNIYKHMQIRVIETKIVIIENILAILFIISVIIIPKYQINSIQIPLSAACAPLIIILAQRFVWYKSLIKSFKTPIIFLKYVLQLLVINLILNICLRIDEYFSFNVIAMLWPCYGFIALSFIFFMGSLLLFFGSFCNQFQTQTESELKMRIQTARLKRDNTQKQNYTKIDLDETFTCTISFWIFLNCSFLMIVSILGFIILLQDIRDDEIFIKGYFGIVAMPVLIILYTIFYYNKIWRWYYVKVMRPSIVNELISIEQLQMIEELERKRQSRTNLMNMFEREVEGGGIDDLESAHSSAIQQLDSSHQSLNNNNNNNNNNKTDPQLKKDMDELYKIKMLDSSNKQLKEEVLSNVPLFLVKVSRSYYQKVEQYTQSFMDRITQKINHHDWEKHQFQQDQYILSMQTKRTKFQGFKKNKTSLYQQQKGSKLQQSHESQRNRGLLKYLKSPDKLGESQDSSQLKQSQIGGGGISNCEYKSTKSKMHSSCLNEFQYESDKNIPYNSHQLEFSLKEDLVLRKESTTTINSDNKPDRMCITNQLNEGMSNLNLNSQFVVESNVSEPEKKQNKIKKQTRRTQSFNISMLNQDKNNTGYVTEKILNGKIIATLQQINKQMGYIISESDQPKKSLQIDKKQLINFNDYKLENEKEDQSVLCILCLERQSDAVILDCGHASICFFCAYKIYRTQNQCHLCRQNISRIIQVERIQNKSMKYQKVIGIVQKINKKFYYSDINKDQVSQFRFLGKQVQEGELKTEYIDEGLNDIKFDLNPPHSAKHSQKNQFSERRNSI